MTVSPSASTAATRRVAGWLSPEEFHLLEVICDTLIPSLTPPAGSSEELTAYYQRRASEVQVPTRVAETLALDSAATQTEFRQLLTTMASPVTGLLLVGRPRSFAELPFELREKYLLAMANSPLALLRQGFQALKRLTGFIYYAAPDEQGQNANWPLLDYETASLPSPEAAATPIRPLRVTEETTLEADVVVIGSGAGGGVVAGELAKAGKSVIVLEKGGYNHEGNFTLQEAEATPELYLKRGALASKDLGVVVLAGSTLGGGTVVNWMTSFRTPPEILDEWARTSGISELTGSGLQESFAAVEQRISVNLENSANNRQNQLLVDGCSALGYHSEVLRRNAVGCEQRCGTCGFGCRYGCKQSTLKTYLQDAYDHGARIIVRCSAEKVIIEDGQAAGVKASVIDEETGQTHILTVRAKRVIVSAGTIHTPAVLLRSGLENRHIGRHLHLHPTTTMAGTYPEKIYPWKGVLQSAYSNEFGHLDGNYGYKLEVPSVHPGLLGLSTPWHSARQYRDQMLKAPNTGILIVLTRDKGEGSITLDRDNEPVINYVVSPYDRRHLLHGIRQAARIHFAAGANGVLSLQSRRTALELPDGSKPTESQFSEFDRQVSSHGLGTNRVMMFTAHQMGTCRMGSDRQEAVVDGNQEVYGVKGLFVCDGSVFPSASGVNPMLSIMGLAHRAAQYIKATL